jgi:hypothetical protein
MSPPLTPINAPRATFRFGAKIADVERVVKLAVTDLGS